MPPGVRERPCFRLPGHRPAQPRSHPGHSKERKAFLHELSDASASRRRPRPSRLCRAMMKATGATAYNILQNNGSDAHQVVMHVHFHIIPKVGENGLESAGGPPRCPQTMPRSFSRLCMALWPRRRDLEVTPSRRQYSPGPPEEYRFASRERFSIRADTRFLYPQEEGRTGSTRRKTSYSTATVPRKTLRKRKPGAC